MASHWMIYGANGYTGRLVAEQAQREGLTPLLGGRNPAALHALGSQLGLECRVFDLGDPQLRVPAQRPPPTDRRQPEP
ncbi:hypothetical protein ACLBUY_19005, partial [Pseudomonas aeruginosa]